MHHLLIDGISNFTIHGGLLRVECTTVGADGKQHPGGTLLIPGPSVPQVLQALITGAQELEKKIREQAPQPPGTQSPVN